MTRFISLLLLTLLVLLPDGLQARDSLIRKAGSLDQWRVIRQRESKIIGGKYKHVHKLQYGDTLYDYKDFRQGDEDILAPCNITADVFGVVKVSNSVTPEPRNGGYCARLEVVLEEVKVLGLVSIEALAQGTIISGTFHEPVTDTKNPYRKISSGVPFTYRPKALRFDYKAEVGNRMVRATGLSPKKVLDDEDYPFIQIILQKRVEDEDGNIKAYRVGTGLKIFNTSVSDWVNGETVEIKYGDITCEPDFHPLSDFKQGSVTHYCINSKGENVMVQEVGWADKTETPTHLVLWISSSMGEAFYGALGNKLWVDNVEFIY